MERLIARLFLVREIAHREHLKTNSYARHMALGDFYDEIVDKADAIAEAYQGKFGIMQDIPFLLPNVQGDIIAVLEANLAIIESTRYEEVPREETAIQNLIDEAVAVFLSTLYKLKTFP